VSDELTEAVNASRAQRGTIIKQNSQKLRRDLYSHGRVELGWVATDNRIVPSSVPDPVAELECVTLP